MLVGGSDQVERNDVVVEGSEPERRAVGAALRRADDRLPVGRTGGEQCALLGVGLERLVHVGDGVAALEKVEARFLVSRPRIARIDVGGLDLEPAAQAVGVERPSAGCRRFGQRPARADARTFTPFCLASAISFWNWAVVSSLRSATVRPVVCCGMKMSRSPDHLAVGLVEILPQLLGVEAGLERRHQLPPPPIGGSPALAQLYSIVAGVIIPSVIQPTNPCRSWLQSTRRAVAILALLRRHGRRLLNLATEIGIGLDRLRRCSRQARLRRLDEILHAAAGGSRHRKCRDCPLEHRSSFRFRHDRSHSPGDRVSLSGRTPAP